MAKYNIAISLGCTNTRILKTGVGVVLNEPTLLLLDLNSKKNPVLAVGDDIKNIHNKTASMQCVSPVKNGNIVNKEYAKIMLNKFLEKVGEKKFFRGSLLWLTPTSLSENDKNEYVNLGYSLGYKNVSILPSAVAGFQELEIDMDNRHAHMLVDIGGGCTDVSVVVRGKVLQGCTAGIGGRDVDSSIVNLLNDAFETKISLEKAKEIKESVNTILPNDQLGCNVMIVDEFGAGSELAISARELRDVYLTFFMKVCNCITSVINMCPNEIVADINKTGIYLSGGLANFTGLDKFIRSKIGIPVYAVERPEFTSMFGCEKLFNEPEKLAHLVTLNS